MSLLPIGMTKYGMPLGKVNEETGEVTITKDWYLLLTQLWSYTVNAGFTTAESALLESAEVDQPPIMSFNGVTGAQTATFTASNKPGTGTTTPDLWIMVPVNGVPHYIPVWK